MIEVSKDTSGNIRSVQASNSKREDDFEDVIEFIKGFGK